MSDAESEPGDQTAGAHRHVDAGRVRSLLKLILLLLAIYAFVVGIKAMGGSFKMFGKEFADTILRTTSSPFTGLLIGVLGTALVQSSSTTTSIIVTMVGAGTITIEGAIPMVMGANIGTTVTNTLVSVGHIAAKDEFRRAFAAATVHDFFNLLTVAVLFPIELATGFLAKLAHGLESVFEDMGGMKLADPLNAVVDPAVDLLKEITLHQPVLLLIVSSVLTVGMLYSIVKILRGLVLHRIEQFFDRYLFRNAALAMVFGFLLTVAVQSSSITTSLVIPLAGAGVLRLLQIFPYTMGANVGTTLTSMFAALATDTPAALTVAFAHLLFNVLGILIVWPIPTVRMIPVKCAEWLANQAVERWYVPFVFVGSVFFLIPALVFFLSRWF